MKKFFIVLFVSIATVLSCMASEYNVMMFTMQSGARHYVSLQNLEVTFTEDMLLADSSEGNLQLPLADVSTMQFYTDTASSLAVVGSAETPVTAYSIFGENCGDFDTLDAAVRSLKTGIYLLKHSDGATMKISIKK